MQRSQVRLSTTIGLAAGALALIGAGVGCRPAPKPPKPFASRPAPRVLVSAPRLQVIRAPGPEPTEPGAAPSAAYLSLNAACDAVERLMAAGLGQRVRRTDGVPFENEFVGAHRTGCELSANGTRSTQPDTAGSRDSGGDLSQVLTAAGWVDIPRYTADGPDGSIFGMRSRETVCIFRGSWDGGDDSDSTYVPSDEWALIGHCAPQEPGDSV